MIYYTFIKCSCCFLGHAGISKLHYIYWALSAVIEIEKATVGLCLSFRPSVSVLAYYSTIVENTPGLPTALKVTL